MGGHLRVRTVAEILACSQSLVYDLIRKGELRAVRIGVQGLRVKKESLEIYLAQREVKD